MTADTTARGRALLDRIDALPAGTWRRCAGCGAMNHADALARHLGTCPQCARPEPLGVPERIESLVDPGSFVETHAQLRPGDPLSFTDRIPYPDRLAQAQQRTGRLDAAVCGRARIGGGAVHLVVLDFAFMGGSMGTVVGEKVVRAATDARADGVPLVVVSASGGARMQEGVLSLMQMARTAAAVRELREAGVPFVSVLTDPVYGGVAASFASLGDVIVAENTARAGFAGPRVVQQTIREDLPDGFQTAAFRHRHGHVDRVVTRAELRPLLVRLLTLLTTPPRPEAPVAAPLPTRPLASAPGTSTPGPASTPGPVERERETAWAAVQAARDPSRPTAPDHVAHLAEDFVELHGDRWSEDDPAVIGGLARICGRTVVLLAHRKGATTAANVEANFGMAHPSGYRKAMRLFTLAERLRLPVVTLVDTPGAHPGLRAEEENQSGAIAETIALAAGLRTPIVSVITGEGGSGGALALAVGDRLLVQEHAIFSVISPEGCAAILFGDAGRAAEAALALRLRACDLRALGVIDEVLPEPGEPEARDRVLAEALARHLDELATVPVADLVAARGHRLRTIGTSATLDPVPAPPPVTFDPDPARPRQRSVR